MRLVRPGRALVRASRRPSHVVTLRYDDALGDEVFSLKRVPDIGVALKIAELIPVPEREATGED